MGKLKKHELLTKAMLDYPAGTVARFKTAPHVHHTSNGIFSFCDFNNDGKLHIICSGTGGNCVYSDGEWATVIPDKVSNFGEILFEKMGIEKIEFVKPSLLSGRVAIQVNNEREFKLLMEHYSKLGWRWQTQAPQNTVVNEEEFWKNETNVIAYQDKCFWLDNGHYCSKELGYKIIPFDQFDKEVSIEVPVFVMTSEDGVPMYRGDDYYRACLIEGEWILTSGVGRFTENDPIRMPAFKSAWFSSKESAEKWVAEANKPQHVEVRLFNSGSSAEVGKDVIMLNIDGYRLGIKPSDLEDMLQAYKSLQS